MKKQKKYTGIKPVSKSSIQITFSFNKKLYRERIKLAPTPANMKKAAGIRIAINKTIEDNTFNYRDFFPKSKKADQFMRENNTCFLLRDYLPQWLNDKEKQLKASAFWSYHRTVVNQIIPAIGHYSLEEIRQKHVKKWVKTLECGNERIGNILAIIRTALQDAVNDEIIDLNAVAGFKYKNKERPKEDHINPFLKEEQTKILEALNGQNKNMIQFAFWTGLRTSELIAVRWLDIDWKRLEVHINKVKTQASSEDEVPKTKKSERFVRLLPKALEALENQKKFTFDKSGHVFLNPISEQRWEGDADVREKVWMPAIAKTTVLYRNPYQTRHTYASMMLSSGEQPAWVAGQMGHNDTTMLARRYGKWMPDAAPDAGLHANQIYG